MTGHCEGSRRIDEMGVTQLETDNNVYTLGRVGSHNVVITGLPGGVYGTISATAVVSHMISSARTGSGFSETGSERQGMIQKL